jgi:hypothetical protein
LHITKQPGKLGTHSQLDLWEQAPIKLLKDGILFTQQSYPGNIVRFTIEGKPIDPFPFLVKSPYAYQTVDGTIV